MSQEIEVSDAEVDELMSKFGSENTGPTITQDEEEVVDAHANTTNERVEPVPASNNPAPVNTQNAPTQPKLAEPVKESEFEFNHKGRTIREPLSMILKRAAQGYDYSQNMAALNQRAQSLTQIESTYKPIDEWVKANPDKWEKLQAVIKQEQAGYGDLPADHPILQKLTKFESVIEEISKERQVAKYKQEDEALDTEIKSIQDKYKDLDWASVDANGRTREQNVLAHANEHGFKTFKTAFLDLYHEDLLKSAETRAREQFAAQKEKQSKVGLLNGAKATSAPAVGANLSKPNNKTKSYPSTNDILEELGISTSR